MLSPPLLPLSPVWSHAAMGGARGCGVAVPSLSLNKSCRYNYKSLKQDQKDLLNLPL